jgi:parvulin-like peptidyl-prolyl isomerase
VAGIEARGGERIEPSVLPSLFDTFIEERVLVLAARARGLVREGASAEEEQQAVQRLLMDQALEEVRVDAEAVKAYYDSHPDEFLFKETVSVRQILVATENEARDARRRLARNPKDFEGLARAASKGPEAANGGVMGVFARGELPPELEAAAFSLKAGGLSDVVKSSLGYHVLRVDSRTEARQASLEESEGRIEALLKREASDRQVREFVKGLLARAKVNHAAAKLPSPRS